MRPSGRKKAPSLTTHPSSEAKRVIYTRHGSASFIEYRPPGPLAIHYRRTIWIATETLTLEKKNYETDRWLWPKKRMSPRFQQLAENEQSGLSRNPGARKCHGTGMSTKCHTGSMNPSSLLWSKNLNDFLHSREPNMNHRGTRGPFTTKCQILLLWVRDMEDGGWREKKKIDLAAFIVTLIIDRWIPLSF